MSPTVPPISIEGEIEFAAVVVGGLAGDDASFMRIGDVGDDLDGAALVVAARRSAGDDVGVDSAGGGVVGLGGVDAGEAFVVAEVEVRLGAVVGDEDLTMLGTGSSCRGRR